ncbi:hypothetical protein [Flavonifractor plautii]|uniref:hypothetical protein n=1 Tax=Flavonifractor plautii TaxID=292800 RepID=UPI0018AC6EC9|nr:hypothetical protein [Flavonifractor plautii]
MSYCQQFNLLISDTFRPFLFRKSAKSRRSYALRFAGIFPVLGQILGQGGRPTSKFAPDINKEGALQFGDGFHGLIRIRFLGYKIEKVALPISVIMRGMGEQPCYYQGEDKGRIYALLFDCLFFYQNLLSETAVYPKVDCGEKNKKSGVTVEFAKSQNVLRRNELREYGCRWEALAQHLLMIMDATPPTEIRVTLTRIIL